VIYAISSIVREITQIKNIIRNVLIENEYVNRKLLRKGGGNTEARAPTWRQQVRRCFVHATENGNDGLVILGLFFKR
jgi:hypothetical protein